MNPSRLRWGVLLILIGGTFLAINMGYLSWWVWLDLLYLWPVLLIAIGLEIILKKTKFQLLGYLSTIMIAACFVWAISEDGGLRDRGSSWGRIAESEAQLEYHNEQAVTVKMNFESGRIYVNDGDPELVRVVGGGVNSRVAMKSNCESGRCEIDLQNEERRIFRRSRIISRDNYWKCYIRQEVEGTFDLDLDETDLRMFAEDLNVRSIEINAIKSDVLLKVGLKQPTLDVKLDGRSTDVDLVIPDSVGIRVEGVSLRESIVENYALSLRDGAYTNSLYGNARVNINVISTIDNGRMSLSSYERATAPSGSI